MIGDREPSEQLGESAEQTSATPDAERSAAPVTGEPEIDLALESLQGLEDAPLTDHHDRLARVHEELHSALNADRSTPES
jgi:hypothetical protein